MCKQVYLVGPSATSVSHVQRGAHRHLVCMRDESCAVSARSCRHQVLLRLHASSGHPGQHAPRRDPQSSGGGSEAARRRPGGRGAAASVSRESSLGHGKKGGFRKGPESAFNKGIPPAARPADRQYSAPGTNPILDRLRSFGQTRGLAFGAYGEASPDVHALLTVAADGLAARPAVARRMGARTQEEARSFVVSSLRRRLGLVICREFARPPHPPGAVHRRAAGRRRAAHAARPAHPLPPDPSPGLC